MFRFAKTLDVITLFHAPKSAASGRVLSLLKKASADAPPSQQFELEVTETAPTADQLRSIIDIIGMDRTKEVVSGAHGPSDAISKLKSQGASAVTRPITVDWSNGKAVIGEHESELLKMVNELPKA